MLAFDYDINKNNHMTTTFSPEDLKVGGPDGLNFSDAWGLTCVQLGVTIGDLVNLRPSVRLTREDLAGYHFIQYGMDPGITSGTLDLVEGATAWHKWDQAQALRDLLPKVLGDTTTDALTFRIRLGKPSNVERLHLGSAFGVNFEVIEDKDHENQTVLSLYPKEGLEVEYKGRTSLHIGSVVMGGILHDLSTYSDVLGLRVEGGSVDHTIVAVSTNRGSLPEIQSIRLM